MDVKAAITLAKQGNLKKPVTISPQAQNRHIWGGDVILCQDHQQRKDVTWKDGELILTVDEFLAACHDIKSGSDISGVIEAMRCFGGGIVLG